MTIVAMSIMTSCLGSDSVDTKYRDANTAYYEQQLNLKDESGENYYSLVVSDWDPKASVLVHWYNDPTKTTGNISPLYSSTVDVKYKLTLYDGTAADSSYTSTSPADSVTRLSLTGVVSGWPIALTKMHIGDSCRIVIPWSQGYGSSDYGDIKAYSTLILDLKLVGVPYYEAKP